MYCITLHYIYIEIVFSMIISEANIYGFCRISLYYLFFISRMQSIQNLGLALISMLAGLIVDLKGYLVLEMFYMIWLCGKCSMVFSLAY